MLLSDMGADVVCIDRPITHTEQHARAMITAGEQVICRGRRSITRHWLSSRNSVAYELKALVANAIVSEQRGG
jgi:hypothetical protein